MWCATVTGIISFSAVFFLDASKEAGEEEIVPETVIPDGPIPVEQPATEGEGAIPQEPVEPTPEQPIEGEHTELWDAKAHSIS